jgi:transmembrane sensor
MQTPQSGTGQSTESVSLSRRRLIRAGLTTAAAAAIGIGLWSRLSRERLSTRIGELGYAELPDGSMALLNTDTEIELAFTRRSRLVKLLRGESLFDVAPDKQRTFIAEAGSFQVVAPENSTVSPRRDTAQVGSLVDYARDVAVPLTRRTSHTLFATRGTTFALRRRSIDTIELVVLEGLTELVYRATHVHLARVSEDTVAQVSGHGPVQKRRINAIELEGKVAWLDRRIVLAGTHTLREAAEEFNRYNEVQLHFEGTIADRQIRGAFDADKPEEFARLIEQTTKAKRHVSGNLITISEQGRP